MRARKFNNDTTKSYSFYLAFLIFITAINTNSAQFVTNHSSIYQANLPLQLAHSKFTDPKFNTNLIRLTNARLDQRNGLFPDYSKRQAWNSDESLLILRSANGAVHIFNGQTYEYIQTIEDITGVQDLFWHPTNPHLIYYILDNAFYSMDVQTLQQTTLFVFSKYAYVSTRAEGNLSNDGHFIALCGYDPNFNPIDFFVFDIFTKTIHSTFSIKGKVTDFDWISISPLGNYVIVDFATELNTPFNGIEVYDNKFNFIWRKPLGAGHSDYGLDSNGVEVLIMDVYRADSNRTFITKYQLKDGMSTTLLSLHPDFDLHESCRAMSRPGWVYISTFDFVGRLTDDSLSWLPFEDEIFALKMDGSGSVQRYAHHHSRRYSPRTPNSDNSVYFSEPHATISNSGKRILFGSNWRTNMDQDTSVDAYIVDLSNLLIANVDFKKTRNLNVKIEPNPVTDDLRLITSSENGTLHFTIYNQSGMYINQIEVNSPIQIISLSNLHKGMYLYYLSDKSGTPILTGKFVKE